MTQISPSYSFLDENEVSIKANGGTELMKRRLAARLDPAVAENFQIICTRVRELKPDKIRVLWIHDLPPDVMAQINTDDLRERFHKIIFCGYWQYNHYHDRAGLSIDTRLAVIDNGIVPIPTHEKPTDEINLVYFSTPQRGLIILVPVFLELAKKFPNAKLHVCSSFSIYGAPEADKQFEQVFKDCKSHPQIVYHGTKTNDEMRELLQKMHIFAYPSIWPECNSLAAIEAMSAGLMPVAPNFAGLSDTFAGGLTPLYQWTPNMEEHAQIFAANLNHAMENIHTEHAKAYTRFMKVYADSRFNIDKIASSWSVLLNNLLIRYPTPESRAIKNTFKYRPFG